MKILLYCLVLYISINAQSFWQPATKDLLPDYGIKAIAIGQNGNIYLGCDSAVGTLFRSTDSGENWFKSKHGLDKVEINGIAIHQNGNIYAAAASDTTPKTGGVFLSEDNGATWRKVNNGIPTYEIEGVFISKAGTIFACTEREGLYRSDNLGQSWSVSISKTLSQRVSHVIQKNNGWLFAVGKGGIFRSLDDGVSWDKLTDTTVARGVSHIVFADTSRLIANFSEGGFAVSNNNGNSWESLPIIFSDYWGHLITARYADFLLKDSSGVLYCGTYGFIKSTDKGVTWNRMEIPGNVSPSCWAMGFSSTVSYMSTSGDAGVLFRSTDNGESWLRVHSGPLEGTEVTECFPTETGSLFTSTHTELYYSSDDGRIWNSVHKLSGKPKTFFVSNAGTIFLMDHDTLASTTDRGITWMKKGFQLPAFNWITELVVDQYNSIYTITVEVDTTRYPAYWYRVFRSTNAGDSWNELAGAYSLKNQTRCITVLDEQVVLLGTHRGVLRSTDNGLTWAKADSAVLENVEILSMRKAANGVVYLGSWYSGMFRSTDKGLTWSKIEFDIFNTSSINGIAVCNRNYIYATTNNYGTRKVYRSLTGGNTWEEITGTLSGSVLNRITISPYSNTVFVASSRGLYRSTVPSLIDAEKTHKKSFQLEQNYPNPFNPITTIRYHLAQADMVTLVVYDVLGREVELLVNEFRPIGQHSVTFSGKNLASGVYLYRLQAGAQVELRKMVLLK